MVFVRGGNIAHHRLTQDTTIRFKVDITDWTPLVIATYLSVLIAIWAESHFNDRIQLFIDNQNIILWFLGRLIDGGVMVPFIAFGVSKLFGGLAKTFDLDLNINYGENVAKVYFFIVIIANCIGCFVFLNNNYDVVSEECRSVITRLVIWVIMAISIWFPIGYGCDGRLNEVKRNTKKINEKGRMEDIIKFYIPIIINMLIVIGISWAEFMEIVILAEVVKKTLGLIYSGTTGFILVALVTICKKKPPKIISNRNLLKSVKNLSKIETTLYYQNIQYKIKQEEEKIRLVVLRRIVLYEGHQKDTDDAFREQSKTFDKNGDIRADYEMVKNYLINVMENRNAYLIKAFRQCREEYRDELIKKKGE